MRAEMMAASQYAQFGFTRRGFTALIVPAKDVAVNCKNKIPPFNSGDWTIHANAVVNGDYSLTLNASAGSQISSVKIPCMPNTTYTFTFNGSKSDSYYTVTNLQELNISSVFVKNNTIDGLGLLTKTITTTNTTQFINVSLYSLAAGTFTFTNPMLTLASAEQTFEPMTEVTYPAYKKQSCADYSNHNNSFQLGSTATADTNDPTFTAQGLTFATDDYLTSAMSELSTAANFTILVAVKHNNTTEECILGKHNATGSSAGNNGLRMMYNNSTTVKAYAYNAAGTDVFVTLDATIANNNIFGMRYNGRLQGMVNGVMSAATADFVYAPNTSKPFTVGKYAYTTSGFLNGSVYAVSIHNCALSDSEYLQNYRAMKRLCASMGVTI